GTPLVLAFLVLAFVRFLSPQLIPLRGLDWAVLIVGAYEAVRLALSGGSANSAWNGEVVAPAVLVFLAVRLVAGTVSQVVIVAELIGFGGAYLAWIAILQFGSTAAALRDVGLAGIVSFRSRLIASPW